MQRFAQLFTRRLLRCGALCAFAFSRLLLADVGLGLSPMRVDLALKPGESYSEALVLNNTSASVERVRGEVLDFFVDDEEQPQFGQFSTEKQSCRAFVRINPTEFDVAPNGQTLVRYTFRVPAELPTGSYYCAAGLTTIPAITTAPVNGLAMSVRVVVTFYITVGVAENQGTIRKILMEADPSDPANRRRVICVLSNPGYFVWRPRGSLDVLSSSGDVLETVSFRSLPVLPQHDQRFLLPLARIPDQAARLRVRLDLGSGEVLETTVGAASLLTQP